MVAFAAVMMGTQSENLHESSILCTRGEALPRTSNSSMAPQLSEPFSVQRNETILVRPSKPTPSHVLSLSTLDNDPNLEIICQTIHVYSGNDDNVDSINQRSDASFVIREALSKALVYYYPLAGKLKRHGDGKLRVDCTGEGVPFMVATANSTLASLSYLDGVHVDVAKCLVFQFESTGDKGRENGSGEHPLMLQVTRFACGGFTIGMGLSHSVCDGFGSAQFFQAMAELAGGKSEPSVKPVWERERLQVVKVNQELPFFPAIALASSPYLPTSDVLHESFNVESDNLRKLKMALIKENCGDVEETFTTLEVLSAYVWRAKIRALELNLDGDTMLSIAVGIRKLINPPLPDGYYGNAFTGSDAVLAVKELSEGPLYRVTKLIKESKKNATKSENIWQKLELLEKLNALNWKLPARGAALVLTDWRHMGHFQVDFGWKSPVNMIPVPWNMFGYVDLCIFLPPCTMNPSMKGGVRVLVCLPKDAMAKFKEEMDGLKSGEPRI